jgi:1,4-dihydroxy-2-naphthoate octaprenyltransferase
MGSYYVQVEELTLDSFLIAIPMGALSCSILVVNNIRDRALDALAGKKTLAVRVGDKTARYGFLFLILAAFITPLALGSWWILITFLAAPFALKVVRGVLGGASGLDLIPLLTKTGKLQLQYSLLLAIALELSHG